MVQRRRGRRKPLKRKSNSKRNNRRTRRPRRRAIPISVKINRFFRRHLIFTGIFFIAVGIILWRLSLTLNFFKQYEIVMWVWLIAGALVLGGIMVLVAWWRNHVSMFTTKHSVNWKNR